MKNIERYIDDINPKGMPLGLILWVRHSNGLNDNFCVGQIVGKIIKIRWF